MALLLRQLFGYFKFLLFQEKDPFWEDSDSEILIGSVHLYMTSLAYMVDLEESLAITDFRGNDNGKFYCKFSEN